jgi:hypothetical protein
MTSVLFIIGYFVRVDMVKIKSLKTPAASRSGRREISFSRASVLAAAAARALSVKPFSFTRAATR